MLKQLNQILSLFTDERRELTVLEAAALIRRPRSTTYRLMSQIEQAGFLDRDGETGLYRLGIKLAVLGELAQRSMSLQRSAQPVLRQLSQETGETATLLLLIDGEGTAVLHSEGSHRVVAKGLLGRYWPLHASAGGKALLAWRPEEETLSLLKKSLTRYTDTTITELAALRRELKQIRERGYSVVRGEFIDDLWGVAVPVFNHRDEIEAAITLGGPRSRVTRERLPELGQALTAAGERMSRALGYEHEYPRVAVGRTPNTTGNGTGGVVADAPRPTKRRTTARPTSAPARRR